MKTLDRYWRVFATGFCFLVFGLGGLTLSFIVVPATRVFTKNKIAREYRVQNAIQRSFNAFCKLMKFTGAIDYKIVGAEKLKQDTNCLIVANHPSLIDYVLIASQLERCDCLVKSAIWANPFMKHIVKAAGYIPNETPDDPVRTERDLRVIHITVSPSFLTKEKKWYQVPPIKPFFLVEVKDKVEVKPFIEQTTSPTIAARRLQQHLSETIFPENVQ
ncbi:lysophospholipid acyltransferase family protein [Vibrio sp. M260118]|uniref:lysophospholipid acyltransferase family protein n=1 Tax=Vibrio sp. M260118 TaxID=3020896 RepID=UPI002F41A965